jgi:hypothetical protein
MAYKKASSNHLLITVICLVVALGFLAFVAVSVSQGPGSTETRASRDGFLTPGDDALSLQQDLNNLRADPGASSEQELNSIQ